MSIDASDDRPLDDHIGAEVSSELKTEARVAAAREGITMSAFVRRSLSREIERVNEDAD